MRARLEEEGEDEVDRVRYARVYMKLGELLNGDFFTEYVKKGTEAQDMLE